MTDSNWNLNDYILKFDPITTVDGPLVEKPILYKVGKVLKFVMVEIVPEIKRAINADAELAGIVLSLALVDYMAGYYAGRQSTGKDYIEFMDQFFPKEYKDFNASIYADLRSGLMHNLAAKNPWRPSAKPFRIHGNLAPHLSLTDEGRVMFSVPIFLEDARRAWIMYCYDLIMKKNPDSDDVERFSKRFDRLDSLGAYMERIPD
jgi:hypothetical protein